MAAASADCDWHSHCFCTLERPGTIGRRRDWHRELQPDRSRRDGRHALNPPATRLIPNRLPDGAASVQLIGNPSKGRYHLSTCADIQSMNPSNKIVLKDHGEARELGLQPCAHCRPLARDR